MAMVELGSLAQRDAGNTTPTASILRASGAISATTRLASFRLNAPASGHSDLPEYADFVAAIARSLRVPAGTAVSAATGRACRPGHAVAREPSAPPASRRFTPSPAY